MWVVTSYSLCTERLPRRGRHSACGVNDTRSRDGLGNEYFRVHVTHPKLVSRKVHPHLSISPPLAFPSSSYRHPCFTSHNSPPEHVQLDRKLNTAALTAPRVFHTRPGLLVDPSALASPTTASPPGLYILRYFIAWTLISDFLVRFIFLFSFP